MTREPNLMIYRVVGVYMMLMAILNFGQLFQVFDPNTGRPDDIAENEIGVDEGLAQTPETRAQQAVGGLTTTMGIANAALALPLFLIGLMTAMGRRWEMFAVIVLVLDAFVKGGNVLSQLAIGDGAGVSILSLVLAVVDIILAVLMYREWQARHDESAAQYDRERAEAQ